MPVEGNSPIGPLIYLSLAISVLLNVISIASIVDWLVGWAGFLKQFVDLYRAWIRESILWAIHLAWPSSWPPIPGWVADWLCINATFFAAVNIHLILKEGRNIFSHCLHQDGFAVAASVTATFFFFGPVIQPFLMLKDRDLHIPGGARRMYLIWLILLGTLVFLAFVNLLLKRAGVW